MSQLERDVRRAVERIRRARAEAGDADAQSTLGSRFANERDPDDDFGYKGYLLTFALAAFSFWLWSAYFGAPGMGIFFAYMFLGILAPKRYGNIVVNGMLVLFLFAMYDSCSSYSGY